MTKRARSEIEADVLSKQGPLDDLQAIKPFILRGAVKDWPAFDSWSGPGGLQTLSSLCEGAEIQVMTSESSSFQGDMEGRQLCSMAFSEFLSLSALSSSQRQHYLAQVPVWTSSPGVDPPLKDLLSQFNLPEFLNPATSRVLHTINFWMASRNGNSSSLHYDQFHNFLCVITGEKTVRLFSPAATKHLCCKPFWGQSANHSPLDCTNDAARSQPPLKHALQYETELHAEAGDAVFIPEGYWHQVSSSGGTIAVNIWFESKVSDLVLESEMSDFYLTRLMQSKVADKAQELLAAIVPHPQLVTLQEGVTEGAQGEESPAEDCRKLEETAHRLMRDHGPLDEQNSQTGYASIFAALKPPGLLRVLHRLSESDSAAVCHMLWALSPAATVLLTEALQLADQESDSKEFFQSLYSDVDDLDGLEKKMVAMEEEFARISAAAYFEERLTC